MLIPIICIVLSLVLTVYLIVRYALPRMVQHRVVLNEEPDTPKAFGPSMAWIAVRSEDSVRIMDALGLLSAKVANWDTGIGAIYDDALADTHIFVSPPVRGITFIAGVALPLPMTRGFLDKLSPLLATLGTEFKDVQYFASFPIIDLYAWARIEKGKITRAFAVGDEGIIWDRGRLTPQERALGLKLFEVRGIKGRKGDAGDAIILHPTQEQVFRLARAWSLAPTDLDEITDEEGTGIVARAPMPWRTERLHKAA